MGFMLRDDVKLWFKNIRPKLDYDFDSYYFCLIAGLVSGYKQNNPPKAEKITDSFPTNYKNTGDLIIGLFLSTELVRMGVDFTDKKGVRKVIYDYIASGSLSHLNEKGMKELNAYSHGGFERLQDNFTDIPRYLETFLRQYANVIKKLQREGPGTRIS